MNLEQLANTIRKDSIQLIYDAGSGHPGGCLSCADILSYLFGRELKGTIEDPNRDRFIASKGHCAPALYSALKRTGRIDYELDQLRRLGSPLQGHPSVTHIPEVETSTGSLGQGLSVGVGMALGLKLRGSAGRVFVLMGEGDMMEGITMEAMAFAGHYNLDNLIVILDYNKYTSDSLALGMEDIESVQERIDYAWDFDKTDGNDLGELEKTFEYINDIGPPWPMFVIASTTKGFGVPFMEGPNYHGSLKLTKDEYERAMKCLDSS